MPSLDAPPGERDETTLRAEGERARQEMKESRRLLENRQTGAMWREREK